MTLAELHCEETNIALGEGEIKQFSAEVPAWTREGKAITREFEFKNFRQAIEFVNNVARLAEEEQHHPDFFISYKKVRLTLSTHKAGGLSRNDFILAAKIDQLV